MACPPGLLDAARQCQWQEIELQKLQACLEIVGGDVASGYRRVVENRLSVDDFAMLSVACRYSYEYGRYTEAYGLLEQFNRASLTEADYTHYFGIASAVTIAAKGDLAAGLANCDQAMDEGIVNQAIIINALPIYFEAGMHDRVRDLMATAHNAFPDDHEVHYSLSWVELARGYYPEGFRLAESRYQFGGRRRVADPSVMSRPRWQGESLAGKRLYVHGEQGYGDIIMMARYLPLLKELGIQVVLTCDAVMRPLLEYNCPDCEIVAIDGKTVPSIEFDAWVASMSLPYCFRTTIDSVPASAGYMQTPNDQAMYWRDRVAQLSPDKRLRVGLAWAGNPTHLYDKRRSLSFELLVPYLEHIEQARFFAIQTKVPKAIPGNLIDVSDEMLTMADTAGLISQMDLVITVDTSPVHVAGALGVPAWLMLPYRYEWRWGLEGEGNAWYDSVRVLRQTQHGDWRSLLDDVFGRRLPEFIANRSRA
jgi:hypothetical protein